MHDSLAPCEVVKRIHVSQAAQDPALCFAKPACGRGSSGGNHVVGQRVQRRADVKVSDSCQMVRRRVVVLSESAVDETKRGRGCGKSTYVRFSPHNAAP
jgi:hypothetical protein